jgi:putative colanic acid biosysnthesis UDP-glucose lipid carrier transferase
MAQQLLFRRSFSVAMITLMQLVLPGVAIVGALAVIARFHDLYFDNLLVGLGWITLLLSALVLRPATSEGPDRQFDPSLLVAGVFARWIALSIALIVIGYLSGLGKYIPRRLIVPWIAISPVLASIVLLVLQRIMRNIAVSQKNLRTVAIVGVNKVSLSLAKKLSGKPEFCSKVLGFFDDRNPERLDPLGDFKVIGQLADVAKFERTEKVDVIFISLPIRHVERVASVLDELRNSTASIYYVPDIFVFDLIQSRTTDVEGIPVVAMCETPFYGYRGVVKRLMDMGVTIAAMIPAIPVMIVIATLVKLTSKGPALFKQRRYGLNGEEILIYKFRTMRVVEDGAQITQATRDDPRITLIGGFLRRYSLDELPQLINVLQGRMSVVGPRPHAVAHNEMYRGLIKGYMVRHKVRPGITGLAQVSGCRGETRDLSEMEARVTYDLEYLRNWSPLLDLRILLLTATHLVRNDKKAY